MGYAMDEIYETISEQISEELYKKYPDITENELERRVEEIMTAPDFCIWNYLNDVADCYR